MKTRNVTIAVLAALLSSAHAGAQVVADLVAAAEIPAGRLFAPHTPAGVVIIGSNLWVGDEVQGLHHYVPVDPANTDPINTGQLMFDIATDWSMGGNSVCVPWCSVGQVAQDGSTRAYVVAYDHQKGQPFQVGGPGVWMVQFQNGFGNFSPFAGASPVAPNLGLAGDQPTAVALGPDGKLYVGFLKNGNIKRVTNPSVLNPTPQNQTVESVGATPNGRSMRAMAFLGADLYVVTDQGLAVVRNAGTCIGNQGGCGNAVLVQDGFTGAAHVGIATDGAGKVYFSVDGAGAVYRYTPADKRVAPVSTGFAFVGGHTNTLTLDGFGNLWIGDDPTDGLLNFSGRIWRIPATALASIP
jgi:hypothetical protein